MTAWALQICCSQSLVGSSYQFLNYGCSPAAIHLEDNNGNRPLHVAPPKGNTIVEYKVHSHNRNGPCAVAFMDDHYPVRGAFSLLNKVLDDYFHAFGDTWKFSTADAIQQWPFLTDALTRFQILIYNGDKLFRETKNDPVDGLVKCEQWAGNAGGTFEELKRMWLLNRVAGQESRNLVDWPYPFVEDELFVLTLSAGLEGYHVQVDGRHVTSFPYRVNGRKEVNQDLKKEADFFRDIVIVPFADSYDLVVLKTVAICEYAARVVSAKYIMKCDDDTFVRLDSVMAEVKKIPDGKSLYLGNMNYYHRPLRQEKLAVSYEEWPREVYPPYANGPGYIVSSDIANFVVSEMEKGRLNLFKMEDVSMGMWVGQFNGSVSAVEYIHSIRFCQFGCVDDYLTAHYQSPGQMVCLWEKLGQGKPQCCNAR